MGPPKYIARQGKSCPDPNTNDSVIKSGNDTTSQTCSKRKSRCRIRKISSGSRPCSKSRSSSVSSATLAELFRSIQQDVRSQYQDQMADSNIKDISMEGTDTDYTNNSDEGDDCSVIYGPAPMWDKFPKDIDIPVGYGIEDELFASAEFDLPYPITPQKISLPIPPVDIVVTGSEAFEHGFLESSDDEGQQTSHDIHTSFEEDPISKKKHASCLEDDIPDALISNSELLSNLVFVSESELTESEKDVIEKRSENNVSYQENTQTKDEKNKCVIKSSDISSTNEKTQLQDKDTNCKEIIEENHKLRESETPRSFVSLIAKYLGVVVSLMGVCVYMWQAYFTTSPGVVHKPDHVYDFIIVGGGTAGSVLAARLSEVSSYKVLLIEAGGEEPWLSSIPLGAPLLQGTKYDWGYKTKPQKHNSQALHDKKSAWPRGKMLGGSGSLNYNVHMFGSPQDYDLWADEYGAKGWSFNDIRKYMNMAQCKILRPKVFKEGHCNSPDHKGEFECTGERSNRRERGEEGHIRQKQDAVQCYDPPIRTVTADSELTQTFLQAGKELGLPVGNLNEDIDYGLMAAETTIYKGRRWSTAKGYLRPALGRNNLHVLLHTTVTKVVWEDKRAVGVSYMTRDNPKLNGTVYARGEVILSGGTINTPQVLIHSGIGPMEDLKRLNIQAVSYLDGVGQNLQDQLNIPLYVSITQPVSLNPSKIGTASNIWDYFVNNGKGDLGRAGIEGVGAVPVRGDHPEVGVILFNMGAVDKNMYSSVSNMKLEYFDEMFPNMNDTSAEGFFMLSSCLHPRSRGQVTVISDNPQDPPEIDPNYLSHPYDITCMRDAFKFTMRLVRTEAFQKLGAVIHLPRFAECVPKGIGKDNGLNEEPRAVYQEYISCLARISTISSYHPMGTARMGRPEDPMAVVDPSLRVIGTSRLRVVDASVMPTELSGNPNSAVAVIAEKAADIIKETWGDGGILTKESICSWSPNCEEELLSGLESSTVQLTSSSLLITCFSLINLHFYDN